MASEVTTMPQTLATEPIPLSRDADGTLRVTGTRIPLETIVRQYREGATPEEIVEDFSSLDLGDVYAVIAYYLKHRDEVEEYLDERRDAATAIRLKTKQRSRQEGLRERLAARLATHSPS